MGTDGRGGFKGVKLEDEGDERVAIGRSVQEGRGVIELQEQLGVLNRRIDYVTKQRDKLYVQNQDLKKRIVALEDMLKGDDDPTKKGWKSFGEHNEYHLGRECSSCREDREADEYDEVAPETLCVKCGKTTVGVFAECRCLVVSSK